MQIGEDDRAALERLEESLWREETRFDRAWMEKLLASDFFEFGRSGRVHDRAAVLGVERQPIAAVLPLPDFSIRMLNATTAQVTYNGIVASRGMTEFSRRSSIWSKSSDGWRLRFHQGTPHQP